MGAFVGDALALGAHWIYDPAQLREACGPMTDFRDPLPDSYHPGKRAGQQSHVGDQTLVLMHSVINARRHFKLETFDRDWRRMWKDYPDYIDHATKATLANEEDAESEELAGAARVAPLIVALADERRETLFKAVTSQTEMTHPGEVSRSAAWLIAELTRSVFETGSVEEALARIHRVDFPGLPLREWLDAVRALPAGDPVAAVGTLGRACPAPQALPAVLYFLVHHADDLEQALIQNTLAGGDNCVRGLVLGTILGAAHGVEAIPARWQDNLIAGKEILHFCS